MLEHVAPAVSEVKAVRPYDGATYRPKRAEVDFRSWRFVTKAAKGKCALGDDNSERWRASSDSQSVAR